MKGKVIGCLVVLVLGLCVVFGVFGNSYNNLVQKEERVKKAAAQVDNVIQRRADLVPNLVNTVKGIVKHEEKVFGDIADARARIGSAGNTAERLQADDDLSNAISRLLMIAEAYPELKSSQNFLELQAQIEGSENRIAVERKRWIDTVEEYNNYARSFPRTFLVGLMGFDRQKETFEAKDREVPTVDFSR